MSKFDLNQFVNIDLTAKVRSLIEMDPGVGVEAIASIGMITVIAERVVRAGEPHVVAERAVGIYQHSAAVGKEVSVLLTPRAAGQQPIGMVLRHSGSEGQNEYRLDCVTVDESTHIEVLAPVRIGFDGTGNISFAAAPVQELLINGVPKRVRRFDVHMRIAQKNEIPAVGTMVYALQHQPQLPVEPLNAELAKAAAEAMKLL